MANEFKAMILANRGTAMRCMELLRQRDPIVHNSWRTNWITTYRYGYRFGATEKNGAGVIYADNKIRTQTAREGVRYRSHRQFIFDPDDTGKITMVVQADWVEVRGSATEMDVWANCRLLYSRGASSVTSLEAQDSRGWPGTNFMGVRMKWVSDHPNSYVEIANAGQLDLFLANSPRKV